MIHLGPPWLPHPDDDKIIASNVAKLDGQLAQRRGHRDQFTLQTSLDWHTEIHQGCQHVPSPQYVGHYRGELQPHLQYCRVGVHDGKGGLAFEGSPPHEVSTELAAFEADLAADLARLDAKIPDAQSAKSRIELVLDVMARHYATWIRIHPLVDGNGRTARILVNWIAVRYWQPLMMPGRPPANKPGLVAATAPAVVSKDHTPLVNEFRKRLKAARVAAALAQKQAAQAITAPAPPPTAP